LGAGSSAALSLTTPQNHMKPLSIKGIGDDYPEIKVERSPDYQMKDESTSPVFTGYVPRRTAMVIESLRKQVAPIGVAQCARILGLDPKTLAKRIAEGKFHSRAILHITPVDLRIDCQALADELEAGQTAVAQ
jgi:hypothetical protein